MIWTAIVIGLLVVAGVITAWSWRSHDAPKSITPPARRILFPFLGDTIAPSTLDAALRLARAEGATLVPAYVVVVPLSLSLSAPVPGECSQAMLLLETIEQRAARVHVAIDSRIETGRSARHAL